MRSFELIELTITPVRIDAAAGAGTTPADAGQKQLRGDAGIQRVALRIDQGKPLALPTERERPPPVAAQYLLTLNAGRIALAVDVVFEIFQAKPELELQGVGGGILQRQR